MARKLNKTKLIKKYFGDIIKEYGFEYGGADAWTWNFFRQKENIKQEIIIMRHRFFANQIKLIFYTGVYRWGDQEAHDFIEKYKNKEFWIYETEEEYISILQEFAEIVKDYGLERLDKMLIPSDPIYATPEMHQYLYESYESLIAEADTKYDFEKTGEEGIEKILKLIYQRKSEDFNEVKPFLIEMSALYVKIIINDIGGKLIMEDDKCFLNNIGKNKRFILPMLYSVETWKKYHNMENTNLKISESILLIKYRQMKEEY